VDAHINIVDLDAPINVMDVEQNEANIKPDAAAEEGKNKNSTNKFKNYDKLTRKKIDLIYNTIK
jgi:hypothetical protein